MLEPVDLVCGGFPCQDISDAGKRAGISGARSGLWREMLRTIRLVRPKIALVENVAALLRRGMGTVLGGLAESGYDAEWNCVSAASVGAPHKRDRIFIVAYAEGIGWREGKPEPKIWGRPAEPDFVSGAMADASGERRERGGANSGSLDKGKSSQPWWMFQPKGRRSFTGSGWWETEPDVGRMAHGIPAGVDRLRCLGNAVVPQVAQKIGELILKDWKI